MATNAKFSIIFNDKVIIKNYDLDVINEPNWEYRLKDHSIWSDPKFSNIWAIQYVNGDHPDEVEYRDETPHTSWNEANLGDIRQFTNLWDEKFTPMAQAEWDADNAEGETEEQKISRLGPRPTNYVSTI